MFIVTFSPGDATTPSILILSTHKETALKMIGYWSKVTQSLSQQIELTANSGSNRGLVVEEGQDLDRPQHQQIQKQTWAALLSTPHTPDCETT